MHIQKRTGGQVCRVCRRLPTRNKSTLEGVRPTMLVAWHFSCKLERCHINQVDGKGERFGIVGLGEAGKLAAV